MSVLSDSSENNVIIAKYEEESEEKGLLDQDRDFDKLVSEHDLTLQYSKKIGIYWIICGGIYWFFYSSRWYLWVSFSRELGEYNETYIAISVNIIFLLTAFSNIFWSYLGDKYTYGLIGFISCIFTLIALITESSSTNYITLLIGSIIAASFRVVNALTLSYLAKYLPSSTSIKYTSYIYASIGISNLFGPVFAGFLSYFINIRSLFIFSAIISFIKLIIMIFLIYGTQNDIHNKQLKFKSLYTYIHDNINSQCVTGNDKLLYLSNDINQFPVSTSRYYLDNNYRYKFIWFMSILITIANGLIMSIEGVIATFYIVFTKDLFNLSILISTTHIMFATTTFIITIIITPTFIKTFKNPNNFKFEFYILFISHIIIILGIHFIINLVKDNSPKWLWLNAFIVAFGISFIGMTQETIILIIQPKKYAGSIAGIKKFIRYFCRAIACLIVGHFMQYDYYWYMYMHIILFSISLIVMIIFSLIYYFHGQTINVNDTMLL